MAIDRKATLVWGGIVTALVLIWGSAIVITAASMFTP